MTMFFFFKQKTAYEMRISDWSSDVCSSDLPIVQLAQHGAGKLVAGPLQQNAVELILHTQQIGMTGLIEILSQVFDFVFQFSLFLRAGVDAKAGATHALQLFPDRIKLPDQIGSAHVRTPVNHAQLVCSPLLEKTK